MKIHSRERVIDEAGRELYEWERKHNLTWGEILQIFTSRMATIAKYRIRYERHGDGDKPGGLE